MKSNMLYDIVRQSMGTVKKSRDEQKLEEHTGQRRKNTGSEGKTGRTPIKKKKAVF